MVKEKVVLTRNEVADYLRVDKSTISRLAKSGELRHFKIGSRLLFKAADVSSFVEEKIVCEEKFREVC
ncbi:helix-turn-helix domain-containing protein [Desulfoplanes sp. PS50]|jgi:excisionase family DNA binding protein